MDNPVEEIRRYRSRFETVGRVLSWLLWIQLAFWLLVLAGQLVGGK
jgi:hypothetical protein